MALAYDPVKGEVFVANVDSNDTSVISDSSNEVVANVTVGSYPTGVAYDSAKEEIFVANVNQGNGTVSVISDTSNKVVAGVSVGL